MAGLGTQDSNLWYARRWGTTLGSVDTSRTGKKKPSILQLRDPPPASRSPAVKSFPGKASLTGTCSEADPLDPEVGDAGGAEDDLRREAAGVSSLKYSSSPSAGGASCLARRTYGSLRPPPPLARFLLRIKNANKKAGKCRPAYCANGPLFFYSFGQRLLRPILYTAIFTHLPPPPSSRIAMMPIATS